LAKRNGLIEVSGRYGGRVTLLVTWQTCQLDDRDNEHGIPLPTADYTLFTRHAESYHDHLSTHVIPQHSLTRSLCPPSCDEAPDEKQPPYAPPVSRTSSRRNRPRTSIPVALSPTTAAPLEALWGPPCPPYTHYTPCHYRRHRPPKAD
jgi:hypothetical protein